MQLFDLAWCQGGGRFIHHDNLDIRDQCLGDFHQLLFGDTESRNRRVRVNFGSKTFKQFLSGDPFFASVDDSQRLLGPAQKQVFPHR